MRVKMRYWSLIELTIILTVLTILCAIIAPVIGRYIRHAQVARAREDTQALGSVIAMFLVDTGHSFFLRDGSWETGVVGGEAGASNAPDLTPDNRVDLLVSDGSIPHEGPDSDPEWQSVVDYAGVDFFEYHLVTNMPGNNEEHGYRTPSDYSNVVPVDGDGSTHDDPGFARRASAGFNSEFSWKGPYITAPIRPDPWGHRYAANVQFLDPIVNSGNDSTWLPGPGDIHEDTTGFGGYEMDVIIISAGPDGEIDTAWSADGFTQSDDDIIYALSGNSRP